MHPLRPSGPRLARQPGHRRLRLAGRRDLTEGTLWACRHMTRPLTILGHPTILKRRWLSGWESLPVLGIPASTNYDWRAPSKMFRNAAHGQRCARVDVGSVETRTTVVQGLLSTVLVGMLGALIAELIRIVPAIRVGRPPHGPELVASTIVVLVGGCAALLGWDAPQPAYKVAVLGAAFPMIFAASLRAARPETSDNRSQDAVAKARTVTTYLAGGF